MKVVKTYNDATLSGASLILKLQSVLGLYAYIRVYSTISAAAGATTDVYTTNLQALDDATLSKDCIVGFVVTSGTPYFTKACRTISAESEAYAGTIASLQIHLDGYLSGIPRIAEVYINSTPYYYKVYPTMISAVIANAQEGAVDETGRPGVSYIPIIETPISGNIPLMTADGKLMTSGYDLDDLDIPQLKVDHIGEHTYGNGVIIDDKLFVGMFSYTASTNLAPIHDINASALLITGVNISPIATAQHNYTIYCVNKIGAVVNMGSYLYGLIFNKIIENTTGTGTPYQKIGQYIKRQTGGSYNIESYIDGNAALSGDVTSRLSYINPTSLPYDAVTDINSIDDYLSVNTLPSYMKSYSPTIMTPEFQTIPATNVIDVSATLSMLIKAVQQLTARIQVLESR